MNAGTSAPSDAADFAQDDKFSFCSGLQTQGTRTGLINRLCQLANLLGPALLLGPTLTWRGALPFMRPVVGQGNRIGIPLARGHPVQPSPGPNRSQNAAPKTSATSKIRQFLQKRRRAGRHFFRFSPPAGRHFLPGEDASVLDAATRGDFVYLQVVTLPGVRTGKIAAFFVVSEDGCR